MLRTISATAEPLYGADIIRAAKHLTGDWRIVHGLSSTETGAIANLVYRWDTPVPNGVLPVGRACPDTIIHLVKEDGTLAAAGETGEIVVTSRFVALGYWNDPAASDAAFRTDPADSRLRRYRSGDLGRWRADGTLEHLGRNNRKIKLRGYSVEPYEIECALLSLPGIRDATVIVSGEGQEARLVAYVVGPADRSSGPVIRGLLAERLPAHLIPAQVTILDALPLTPRGKVDRNALPVVAFKASPVPMRPPSTATERTLTLIWQRYLKFEGVGVDDNFYDVGGTSLQAFLIFASIAQKLGHDLPPTTMLEAPTIALQAALLDRKGTASKASKLIAFREHGSQPPLFLVHAGFGEIAYGRELARHLRSDRPVYGVRPPALDGKERISRTLESIAADYLAELRTVQANGPYFLAGHSFGGWVAFEMACQLERQNESIGFVGLIDTYAKSTPKYRETAVPRLARHAKALHRRSLRSVADYVGTRAVKNFSFGVEAARLAALGWLPKNVGKWTIGLPSYAMRPDLYRRIHRRASRNYRPQVFGGRIVVFGAQGMAETHETHWSPLIRGGVTVVEIPAGHSSMVWPPHSETLAAAFDAFLGSTARP
jgi:thioesterase domain-containing protein